MSSLEKKGGKILVWNNQEAVSVVICLVLGSNSKDHVLSLRASFLEGEKDNF